jgi:hypothetical protein
MAQGQIMRINWAKGFFRAWAVLASVWIFASGWYAYSTFTDYSFIHPQDDCWDQIAKWPGGRPFDVWDGDFDDYVAPGFEKAAEYSIAIERNRWRQAIRQKLDDCEAAKGLVHRVTLWVTENSSGLRSSLQLILLPPLGLLIAGCLLAWIVSGFRRSA